MKVSKKLHEGLGVLGILLCAACCALSIFGIMLGIGTLSVLLKYFEWAGIAAILLSVISFGIYLLRKRRSTKAQSGCGCETNKALTTGGPGALKAHKAMSCDITCLSQTDSRQGI